MAEDMGGGGTDGTARGRRVYWRPRTADIPRTRMASEVVIALLAVAKIGAVFIPLFSGYGPEAVAVRLSDCEAKLLVSADGFYRRGALVPMKQTADAALEKAPTVLHQVVVRRADV